MDFIFSRFAPFAVITAWILLVTGCSDGTSFPADNSLIYEQGEGTGTVGGGDTGTGGAEGAGDFEDVSPEGLWRGSTNTDRTILGVVLDDGEYWFIYSSAGNSDVIAGVAQGNAASTPASADSGSLTSVNGKDFNFEGLGVIDFTLDGYFWALDSIVPGPRMDGSIEYSFGSISFESFYDSSYEKVPSLEDIAGNYTGSSYSSGGPDSAAVTITNSGAIDGIGASGCTFSGTASPRASGNIYDVTVTFGGGVCANGTNTVTGIAYYEALNKEFTSVGLNSSRTDGYIYVGSKP